VALLLYLVVGLFTHKSQPAANALLQAINRDFTANQLADEIGHPDEISRELISSRICKWTPNP
jgi:hypothetical protein